MLAKAHLWGFRYHDGQAMTGERIQACLWKVFYYQRDECRPKDWVDIFNWERDTGPRLLRYNIDPRPDPVSRFYPSLPVIGPRLQRDMSHRKRPWDAPENMADEIIEQFLFGVWKKGVLYPRPHSPSDVDKSGGTSIYIKSPDGLPYPGNVSPDDIVKSLTAVGTVGEGDIEAVQRCLPDGWAAKFKSTSLAWTMRSARLNICGWATHTMLYKREGARIFSVQIMAQQTRGLPWLKVF
ncbi:hypothetical protein N7492_001218 [Penicillium capsulatum]|uniref:Uncharacterized protein n=1 Tax=Penicillium capsulatum TaxID=69766 RepID=A0A9W9IT83_9EURO|nr:hypothetical protein N7492_001218 [Penicillium capsulatum]KAJ6129724.1 hypothetical protein N7512_002504 [Penicillium capsulatum]